MKVSANSSYIVPVSTEGKIVDVTTGTTGGSSDNVVVTNEQDVSENRAEVAKAVDKLNQTVELYNQELKFVLHDETQRFIVQVIDKASEEVITEMPPKKILDMVAAFKEMVGLLVDKRV
jgi:flagellar protein FlaG